MKTEVLTDPRELTPAWSRQYERAARVFSDMLGKKSGRIAEIGCGNGQLTIPLAKRAPHVHFTLVDRFVGTNYYTNYRVLVGKLQKEKLRRRAVIVVSDYMKWLSKQDDNTFDAVISSEFIPEIDSGETHQFIQECYRITKAEGATVHSFLSPLPRNHRQELLITADSNPLWTHTPPKEWFSPPRELVLREMRKSRFQRIQQTTFRSRLIMKADAAKNWLKTGEMKASFYKKHKTELDEGGLEVPDWVIVSGVKPRLPHGRSR